MIILALDYGEKRIGVAKSDELGMFAHGQGYIENQGEDYVLKEISGKAAEYRADKILIGLPVKLSGEMGIAAEKVLRFVETLKRAVTIPVETIDERMSTKGANAFLRSSNMSGKKKRQKIDQIAAEILLQTYLDTHRF